MTDKTTDAANAWLILNDADVVEKKLIDFMTKLFREDDVNRDMFMHMLMGSRAAHERIHTAIENQLYYRLADMLKHTLETAEVVIQDDIRTYKPQIAIRFSPRHGGSFVVYPKISRI